MSNVALFSGANAPAFAKRAELSDLAKALAGGGSASGKRVSIKGGVFRLLAGGKEVANIEDRHLDVVIVSAAPKVSRVFYAKSYDGDNVSAPDCWSQNGDVPAPDATNKQAKSCSECPQNIAGSGQGNSRACRYQQRMAVVLANDIEGEVMQLALPATSIFGKAEGENRPLQEYARFLVAQNVDPGMVVTRMKFDTKSESPKLFFKPMRWLTDDEYEIAQDKGKTPEAQQAVTLTVAKQDGVVATPMPAGAPPKAKTKPVVQEEEDEAPAPPPKSKAKPAPVVEDDEDEDEAPAPAPKKSRTKPPVEEVEDAKVVDEPEVRKEAKAQAPAAKGSLASMISDWDDEG
jgi:hypothetical protein